MMDWLKVVVNFVQARVDRTSKLLYKYTVVSNTWQCETDSKIELTDYCGLKIGKRFLNFSDKIRVFYQDQSRSLRLLSIDFGLNKLKHKCWKAELPLCRCGKYDTPSHFIFCCKKLERKRFFDLLKQENIDRSLIALISCNNYRAIMVLVFFSWNKTQLFSYLVISEALILSTEYHYFLLGWNIYLCNHDNKKTRSLSLSLSLSLSSSNYFGFFKIYCFSAFLWILWLS